MTFQCCFCGSAIEGKQPPIAMAVELGDSATQTLRSHSACLTDALHPSVPAAFAGAGVIYMPLLDEGVDVWRPVQARKVKAGLYRIDEWEVTPEHERWPFKPGATLRCELKTFSDGAVALVPVAEG